MGVGVGGLFVVVAFVFLLRWFRRVRQRHEFEHGALTEQLLATEKQRFELEIEGLSALFCILFLNISLLLSLMNSHL